MRPSGKKHVLLKDPYFFTDPAAHTNKNAVIIPPTRG